MFKGISSINSPTTTEILDINLKYWLDWSFLNIGAFKNVTITTSGSYGGQYSRLIPIKDRFNTDGKTWKTFHNNLVFESGLSYNTQPISISGVYINGVLTTDYTLNYPEGKVIFTNPISSSSLVEMEYSYKYFNVYSAGEVDWLNEVQSDSFRIDRQDYSTHSGEYSYNRLQLPAIVFETKNRTFKPYQLGHGQFSYNTLKFHILSNNRNINEKISDILCEQNDKTIPLFNVQKVFASGVQALNVNGVLNPQAQTYNDLTNIHSEYFWNTTFLHKANLQETQELKTGLFYTPIHIMSEIILPSI